MPRKKTTNTVDATVNSVSKQNKSASVDVSTKPKTQTAKPSTNKKILRRVPPTTLVPVMSNCSNPLIYNSRRQNGYIVEWEEYGTIEYMEVSELIAMRSTALRFYRDNWIVVLDCEDGDEPYTADEIYNTIGVANYYKDVVTPRNIDDLLCKPANVIRKRLSGLSVGLRRTVYEYAKNKQESGEFDSIERLNTIKEMAGYAD